MLIVKGKKRESQKMTITTKNLVALIKSHRSILCRIRESAVLAGSLFQSYIDSWFNNYPATVGEP